MLATDAVAVGREEERTKKTDAQGSSVRGAKGTFQASISCLSPKVDDSGVQG